MKKIVIATVIALAAVCSQANTLLWGVNSTGGTMDATKFASGTCYLLLTDASTGLPDYSGLASKTSFSNTDLKSTSLVTGSMSAGAFLSDGDVVKSLSGKTYFYMAVISDDGKNIAISTSTKTASMGDNENNTNLKWTASQFKTYSAASIPEPTSGLLLVLGGAMLALRRRRA